MGDNNKSKIQFNPFKKKEVKDDRQPGLTADTRTKKDKPGFLSKSKNFFKKTGQVVVDKTSKVGVVVKDKATGTVMGTVQPLMDINDRIANGEKVGTKEVITTLGGTALKLGATASGATLVPGAVDIVSDVAVKSEFIETGTAEKVKTGIRIYTDPTKFVTDSITSKGIEFVAENDPTNATQIAIDAKNTLEATKKPGVRLSDKIATAKSVADKVTAKNKSKLKSRDSAVEMWRAHIGKKITAVNDYLIKTSTTGYKGLGGALRNEVRDALLQIYLRNTNSISIYDKTTSQVNKMYEIIREYASGGYHVDGKVTLQEYNKLNLFMKQYLTHNGSFNLPPSSSSSSQELENNSVIQDLGGANHGGPGGLRMETLSGEVIWESLKQSRPHQTGETFFELDLINESGDTIQTLEFSEYFGDASCAEGSGDCTVCKEIDKVSNVKSAFDWNRTEFQVWFDVDGLEEQRGYEFPIDDISVNPSEVKRVKLRPKKKEDNNE